MKKIHFLIIISILLCAVFAFALVGCNADGALAAPVGLKLDGPTLTLSWKANDNARYYVVNVSGGGISEDKNTRKNSLSLANLGLDEGDYRLKVKAIGDGKEHKDSDWSKAISFHQDADSGLTFKFINNNKEVEVVSLGRAQGDVVIPDTFRGVPVTRIGERAFASKSGITGIVISDNVTAIGDSAFYNCAFLRSATLSQNLTAIGDKAFQSCRLLEGELEIPEDVTVIGENAFAYCTSLTGVKLGDKVETIGKNAFAYCSGLLSLDIPDSVETIGDSAFYKCEGLSSVRFGSGLKTIYDYAFASCIGLESVTLNDGLERIADYAFIMCNELKSVTLSDSVESIGEGAFWLDAKLDDVTLGAGLKRIGKGAFIDSGVWKNTQQNDVYLGGWFLGCKDNTVTSLSIANGTIGIANYALSGFENLITVILPNSVKIIGDCAFFASKLSNVVIGSGAEEIGVQAFYNCDMLSNVILGSYVGGELGDSSLKTIDAYAFMGCTQLASIEIPSCVEVINSYAFNGTALYDSAASGVVYADGWVVACDNTRANGRVVIKDGTVGIANYAFYNCTNVSGVQIPDSVRVIGRSAFYQCTSLANVVLPSGLEVIEDYAFYGCSNLVLPELPGTLRSIGRSAFYKCALSNASGVDTDSDVLIIPDSVEYIGDYAFFGCGYVSFDTENMLVLKCGIDAVLFGDGVKYIGSNAFNSVPTLRRVEFGNGVLEVGAKAFYKCAALSEVVFNEGLLHIGARAFYGCDSLTDVSLPNSLTEVDGYAFYKCLGLSQISFGVGVQSIGEFAFYGCSSLNAVVLPSSVTHIGRQAFRGCVGLESIVLPSSVTEIDAHAFYGCSSLTIYAQDRAAQAGWDARFNSSYRPVVWGCTVRDGYVYSVTKSASTVSYLNDTNALSAPYREGYSFIGWSRTEGANSAEYTADDLSTVKDGTRLYAVWAVVDNSEI